MLDDEVVTLDISMHSLLLEAWLIMVGLVIHHGLDGDEQAAQGQGWAPGGSGPGAKNRQADHPILVEIRVEPDCALAGGH